MNQSQHHRSALVHSNEGAHRAAQRLSNGSARPSRLKRGFTLALSAALAASFSSAMPALAYASNVKISDEAIEQVKSALNGTSTVTAYAKQKATTKAASSSSLPSSYDLRDPNSDGDTSDSVVTPVKNQAPWGTCWGFSAIAACETSILSKAAKSGLSDQVQDLDLSELQLAWSVYKKDGAPASIVGDEQAGEGYHTESSDPNKYLDNGGQTGWAASTFAAGIGPVYEFYAPYGNKDGIYSCKVTLAGSDKPVIKNLTDDEIEMYKSGGATVQKRFYSGNYKDDNGEMHYTDWTVDDTIWNFTSFQFENANMLPATLIKDEKTGAYKGTDEQAVEAIKSEIHEGRAVSCAFYADISHPDDKSGLAKYIDTNTWAHYTYDETENPNHAVTIVGWDDNYSADNFNNDEGKKPEGNGAWLVKNSWGADTESFPNNQAQREFGILDEDGNHTGYFWLSYYDRSICEFETFDFDLNNYSDRGSYAIDQYDYMPQNALIAMGDTKSASSANVFTADYNVVLRTLSTEVARPNSTVTYKVYLLDKKAKTPTDGKKVYTQKVTYDYSGYHRFTLDTADWIGLRKGQRYSVVVTQKCNDDGLYYTCAGMNSGKPTEKTVEEYKESETEVVRNNYYNEFYELQYDHYIDLGQSKEEAKTQAEADADSYIELTNTKTAMEQEIATKVEDFRTSYFVSKVNKGESYTNSAAMLEMKKSPGWYDWSMIATSDMVSALGAAIDNVPIKAFSEFYDWATVKQLTTLNKKLTAAKKLLKNAIISEDGAGLTKAQTWITQNDHDCLETAVEVAEALMDQAGKDYKTTLTNTTPTKDEATAAIDALAITTNKGGIMAANTIKAAKSKLTVKKGKTAKVKIKKAQGKVTVTCSNKKVKASYKNGKLVITGKKKGSATIKVKAAGNSTYKAGTAKIKVTVK